MIKFSIIIPYYNNPELLARCIASIPDRNDLQIIIIDDNSDIKFIPSKFNICFHYADFVFLRLHKTKGAGHARNKGLELVNGKYVIFADSDDFFTDNFNDILNKYSEANFDIVYLNYISVLSENIFSINKKRNYRHSMFFVIKNKKHLENFLRYEFGPPWSKILSMDLIENFNIRFDECMKHNDTMFSMLTGYYASNIHIDNTIIYANTYRECSITTKKISGDIKKYIKDLLDVDFRYMDFAKENKIKIAHWRYHYVLESFIRRDKNWKIIKEALYQYHKKGILLKIIITSPIYLIHRFFKMVKISTEYLF